VQPSAARTISGFDCLFESVPDNNPNEGLMLTIGYLNPPVHTEIHVSD